MGLEPPNPLYLPLCSLRLPNPWHSVLGVPLFKTQIYSCLPVSPVNSTVLSNCPAPVPAPPPIVVLSNSVKALRDAKVWFREVETGRKGAQQHRVAYSREALVGVRDLVFPNAEYLFVLLSSRRKRERNDSDGNSASYATCTNTVTADHFHKMCLIQNGCGTYQTNEPFCGFRDMRTAAPRWDNNVAGVVTAVLPSIFGRIIIVDRGPVYCVIQT